MKLKPGLYDQIITREWWRRIEALVRVETETVALAPKEAALYAARLIAAEMRRELEELDEPELIARANAILERDPIVEPARILRSIYDGTAPAAPTTPLSVSGLIVNAQHEPRLGFELEREMETADEVWMIVSFIKWLGWQRMRPAFEALERAGKRVRVLTTTYMGASDYSALAALARLSNVEMKISLDRQRRRLHAKAYLFVRESGFSSAYIGSANLSQAALEDGLEWTVKMSEVESPHVIDKFRGAFESSWNDAAFERFHPEAEQFAVRVREELQSAGRSEPMVFFALRPHDYQQATLERLEAERQVQGRWRNLVVAPTGTGKTMLAAFDYERQGTPRRRMLFLAHREELLRQARTTFRQVLRDESFGELLVGGEEAASHEFLFASVQSMISRQLLERQGPEYWDYVVLDEAHHSTADTYRQLLDHLHPRVLLGLTATPERMDGESILPCFDHAVADEMRLWHAIEEQYLSPFDYYGIADGTDLRELAWTRGRYEVAALNQMLSRNERRARLVLQQFADHYGEVQSARALGFCVSVEHAEFMAEVFRRAGIAAEAVTGQSSEAARESAPRRLERRELNILFTVDLYNEGVDLPFVDCLLFLRPTESATVFLQQLGRGLRRAEGKQSCLVLDFIGNQRREFRFDLRYQALFGGTRREVREQLQSGVTRLPGNCYFRLDRQAQAYVLDNLKETLSRRRERMLGELRRYTERPTLARYLADTGYELEDVYSTTGKGWSGLLADAGWAEASGAERLLSEQFRFLLHWDCPLRIEAARRLEAPRNATEARWDEMLTVLLLTGRTREWATGPDTARCLIAGSAVLSAEFEDLMMCLRERVGLHRVEQTDGEDWPLVLHRRYTVKEVLAAVGEETALRRTAFREGVKWMEQERTLLLFVQMVKPENRFNPAVRYKDYAVSPTRFHWQSQNKTREDSEPGQRYVRQREQGIRVLLFVQPAPGSAYTFLGEADYVEHHGERPMNVLWELRVPMPAVFFSVCASLRAA